MDFTMTTSLYPKRSDLEMSHATLQICTVMMTQYTRVPLLQIDGGVILYKAVIDSANERGQP
jgi:hypothetical protein